MLGQDAARVQEVESQELTAYAKPEGGTEAASFVLKAEAQPGDAAGKTSAFAGALPRELQGQRVEVTVPSIRIGGERFRFSFASAVPHEDRPTPPASDDEAARALYLTPGGRYTAADIQANGNTTAAEKYKGVPSSHNVKPAPGERVCPVTSTKANPHFTWIVAGKSYTFCCPPCIDEFVQLAKDRPDLVKAPGVFVWTK